MAKYTKKQKVSPETRDEAMKIARANQRPGQTKEQTRLIAQGIQKGIDQYKKQYKAKVRELDKQQKKQSVGRQDDSSDTEPSDDVIKTRQSLLPWILLIVSWVGFGVYLFAR